MGTAQDRHGLCATPETPAPDQITPLSDHCLLNRDEGIWHRFTAVVLQISEFSRAETYCGIRHALCERHRRKTSPKR